MITRYDSEVEDITFETPEELLQRLLGEGGAGAKRPLEALSATQLRQHRRAELISDADWAAELQARGMSAAAASAEIAYQKTVGISTAKATAGQLLPGEQAAVDALRASPPVTPAAPASATQSLTAGAFNQLTGSPTTLQGRLQQSLQTMANPLVPEGSTSAAGGVGPSGRTVAQIKGTEYLSDAERTWYLQQTSGKAPSSDAASRVATASGGTSAAAPAKPKGPAPGSKEDLLLRGGIPVGSAITLQGQQYRDTTSVQQADDGKYYVVDKETGNVVSGPYNTSTEAGRNAPLANLGPAVTSNSSTNLGSMALAGPNRPLIPAGSGLQSAIPFDQIIASTYTRGKQAGDFLGARSIPGIKGPVDVARGGVPDYGGMTAVTDAAGNVAGGFTGRVNTDDGVVGVGASGINQVGTHYGSQAQQAFAPYLSQSQINKLDPATINETLLKLTTLRDQGVIKQADTAATKQYLAANAAALGLDPYDLELFPDVPAYEHGGDLMLDEPTYLVTASGEVVGLAGEAGKKEKVTFTPTNQTQGGMKRKGGLQMFATGGEAIVEPNPFARPFPQRQPFFGPAAPLLPAEDEATYVGTLPTDNWFGTSNWLNEWQAQQDAREAEAKAKAQAEAEAKRQVQYALANAAADAEAARRRQFEDSRYLAVGMPPPLTANPNFSGMGGAWDYFTGNLQKMADRIPLGTGTRWPIGLRNPAAAAFDPERERSRDEGERNRDGDWWNGGRDEGYPDDFEGPLPGPRPNLPDERRRMQDDDRRRARRFGVDPQQMRGWRVGGWKPPVGAGLQVA